MESFACTARAPRVLTHPQSWLSQHMLLILFVLTDTYLPPLWIWPSYFELLKVVSCGFYAGLPCSSAPGWLPQKSSHELWEYHSISQIPYLQTAFLSSGDHVPPPLWMFCSCPFFVKSSPPRVLPCTRRSEGSSVGTPAPFASHLKPKPSTESMARWI